MSETRSRLTPSTCQLAHSHSHSLTLVFPLVLEALCLALRFGQCEYPPPLKPSSCVLLSLFFVQGLCLFVFFFCFFFASSKPVLKPGERDAAVSQPHSLCSLDQRAMRGARTAKDAIANVSRCSARQTWIKGLRLYRSFSATSSERSPVSRDRILRDAVQLVPEKGWTIDAIAAVLPQHGLSPASHECSSTDITTSCRLRRTRYMRFKLPCVDSRHL